MDALNIAGLGLVDAADRLSASAARTALGAGDLASELIEQVSAKTQFEACAAVVRTTDQMAKRLLDVRV